MRLLILSFSLLTGCALFQAQPVLMQDNFRLMFEFSDDPNPSRNGEGASALWMDGLCIIRVKPDYYTHRCLGHELRHCLEGNWHAGRDEGC